MAAALLQALRGRIGQQGGQVALPAHVHTPDVITRVVLAGVDDEAGYGGALCVGWVRGGAGYGGAHCRGGPHKGAGGGTLQVGAKQGAKKPGMLHTEGHTAWGGGDEGSYGGALSRGGRRGREGRGDGRYRY